jgi:hypothetical protein
VRKQIANPFALNAVRVTPPCYPIRNIVWSVSSSLTLVTSQMELTAECAKQTARHAQMHQIAMSARMVILNQAQEIVWLAQRTANIARPPQSALSVIQSFSLKITFATDARTRAG